MSWNFMQAELDTRTRIIRPLLGPGELTRTEAHAEIQSILDRAALGSNEVRRLALAWREGAKDDTVTAGPFTWAIYEHGDDPRLAAREWLEDFAVRMRAVGVDAQVALD